MKQNPNTTEQQRAPHIPVVRRPSSARSMGNNPAIGRLARQRCYATVTIAVGRRFRRDNSNEKSWFLGAWVSSASSEPRRLHSDHQHQRHRYPRRHQRHQPRLSANAPEPATPPAIAPSAPSAPSLRPSAPGTSNVISQRRQPTHRHHQPAPPPTKPTKSMPSTQVSADPSERNRASLHPYTPGAADRSWSLGRRASPGTARSSRGCGRARTAS